MLDFSKIEELTPLAQLVRAVRTEAQNLDFVLAGAQARDLLLKYAHDIETGRQTADVDFAFRVESWEEFHSLRARLIASGDFSATRTLHKLAFRGALEIDIVPFGGIERPDRTIEWPPAGDEVMSLFGFREVVHSAILVQLPEGQQVRTVSLPALALLKLAAWCDRRRTHPGKDAYDLRLIIENYANCNERRLFDDFADLLDLGYVEAGACVLGHDLGQLVDEKGRDWLDRLLDREADENGQLSLVGDLRIDPAMALEYIRAILRGLTLPPRGPAVVVGEGRA